MSSGRRTRGIRRFSATVASIEMRLRARSINAVVVAKDKQIVALNLANGQVLWSRPLPAPPVTWGVAVDRDGRVVVTLEDGQVLCFG